ncbi:alpha/beta fold hydrolase [Solitalea canadensis]|uniref:Putative hydrolase or acyltransferase of alpha/beta superfamily n=1 Tax=Solitalea canadensis (strain ATCC 29591 / DSM 3403 / JCM 21819 / LMG 8368 / NBRC 15130 / NCIMB 12057 / USAM 9D) TaxID=929556 RepID=H8KKV7_SOLCM|nr:alpha/beta hydrolase [Solitalea canadensis]AFD08590.1 putative hydrolase or acyltransferase of alpha/beta superfamily [Solitalea canadensis DSM 3403]
MKRTIIYAVFVLLILESCNKANKSQENVTQTSANVKDSLTFKRGYSDVNGIKMYYEIYGKGSPLVLIHGGGSTIQTTFGRVIPQLARDRQVIAVELQAHGRTSDRSADLTFEQDADDVAALLKNIGIDKADFFGFSNGGTTTMQIAIRHPEIVNKIILGSTLAKRNGVPEQFWGFMKQARLENMPQQLKEAYKQVAPDSNGLQVMHDKDAKRVINFKDITDEKISSIKAPTLIIIGDKDVITPEHALEMHQLIANSQLAIIPGAHGEYIGEITTIKGNYKETDFVIPMIEKFLQ